MKKDYVNRLSKLYPEVETEVLKMVADHLIKTRVKKIDEEIVKAEPLVKAFDRIYKDEMYKNVKPKK